MNWLLRAAFQALAVLGAITMVREKLMPSRHHEEPEVQPK
jgi:hypothetical protein